MHGVNNASLSAYLHGYASSRQKPVRLSAYPRDNMKRWIAEIIRPIGEGNVSASRANERPCKARTGLSHRRTTASLVDYTTNFECTVDRTASNSSHRGVNAEIKDKRK